MKCLSDAQIQAVIDNEAAGDTRGHASSCERCAARVRERQARTDAIAFALDVPVAVPPTLEARIERHVAGTATTAGATRLRDRSTRERTWSRGAWGAAAVAAATIIAVLFIAPMARGPATVSASEILAKSASRLAKVATTGIELLEYELVLDGVPREWMPENENGTYHVKQVIDHDVPGRYRFSSYAPDGQLLSSIAQDPVAHRRVAVVRLEDQSYRFDFEIPQNAPLSTLDLERLHMEATVTMMQASDNQQLQTLDTATGRQYLIEVPRVSAPGTNPVWDLAQARVLINAEDFRIEEFSTSGTLLKQPYSISYRLIGRSIVSAVAPEEFAIPSDPGAIIVQGKGSANPLSDALFGALRELARTRQKN